MFTKIQSFKSLQKYNRPLSSCQNFSCLQFKEYLKLGKNKLKKEAQYVFIKNEFFNAESRFLMMEMQRK